MLIKTPHIHADTRNFAKTVLMPGDPKRAEMIAQTYLKDVKIVSGVRGIYAYTGYFVDDVTHHDKLITVMASGMGMGSIGIYAHELFTMFGVETIIRIGSAGGINENLQLGDIVIAQAACSDADYLRKYNIGGTFCPIADYATMSSLVDSANKCCKKSKCYVGNILSTDNFYGPADATWNKMGVLAVEMEAAALFAEAAITGKKAACICTVSDLLFDLNQSMSANEREQKLHTMIKIALDAAK